MKKTIYTLLIFIVSTSRVTCSDELSLGSILDLKGTVTASKKLLAVSQAPGSTIIITRSEILERGYINLQELLADLPGMETVENYFAEQGTLVPIRGVVGNNKILVLLNSMALNPPGRENMMFRNDTSIRHAKRVEVVYGPGSTLYGTDAVSAVINIITVDDERVFGSGEFLASYGNQSAFESSARLTKSIANKKINIWAQFRSDDGVDIDHHKDERASVDSSFNSYPHSKDQSPYANADRKSKNLYASYEVEDTKFQYFYRNSKRPSANGYFNTNTGDAILLYSDYAKWEDSSHLVRMQNNLELNTNHSLKSSLTYNRYEIDEETRYVFPSGGAYFYEDTKYGRGKSFEYETQWNWDISDSISMITGVEVRDVESVPKATIDPAYNDSISISEQTGSISYTEGGVTKTAKKVNIIEYQTYGLYWQGDAKMTDSLKAVLGFRYNVFSNSSKNPLVPRASLIFSLSEASTLKLNYGEAFVAQSPYFAYNVFSNGAQYNISNPKLNPEKSRTLDLNYLYKNEGTDLHLSGYYNSFEDLWIIEDTVNGKVGTADDGNPVTKTVNGGELKTYGVDVLIRQEFKGSYSGFLAMSYVDGEEIKGSIKYELPSISKLHFKLGTTFKLLGGSLVLSPRLRWSDDPKTVSGAKSHADVSSIKDLYQLDFYSKYSFGKGHSIFAKINNLTNHSYKKRGLVASSGTKSSSMQDGFLASVGYSISY